MNRMILAVALSLIAPSAGCIGPAPDEQTEGGGLLSIGLDGPVDMREYYPTTYRLTRFRRADGSLYSLVKVKPVDTILGFHGPQPSGAVNYSIEYYYTQEHRVPSYPGDDPPACFRTARSFRNGSDGHVIELGGSPLHFQDTNCYTAWTRGGVTTYRRNGEGTGLYWGRPGFNEVGEPYYGVFGMDVWFTATQGQPLQAIGRAFGTHHLERVHPSFTPTYGRDSAGNWCRGCGEPYHDVAEVIFIHGTDYSWIPEKTGEDACENHPFAHIDGYNSYWIRTYLAPGVGAVQEEIMFMEDAQGVTCSGSAVDSSPEHFTYYIDE